MDLELSEYTFANIYLFREIHRYEVIHSQDIYIKGKTRDGMTYIMPTTSFKEINCQDLISCMEGADFVFPIPEIWLSSIPKDLFSVAYFEQDSDYLYATTKLSTYAGRHLSGRRNLVKQFLDLYPDHCNCSLDISHVSDALVILEEWHKHAREEEPFTDYEACREALQLLDKLHLCGHICYAGGRPIAFLIGEKLNTSTYVIHFAKGLIEYKGIYQYLYHQFAKSILNRFQMINLEQDLGSMELKNAKRAYLPDRYALKYRVAKTLS
jgi:hypothetical protein